MNLNSKLLFDTFNRLAITSKIDLYGKNSGLNPIRPTISYQFLKNLIIDVKNNYKSVLEKILKSQRNSITVDVWQANSGSDLLGIRLMFLNG